MRPYKPEETPSDHPEWPPLSYPARYRRENGRQKKKEQESSGVNREMPITKARPKTPVRPDTRIEEHVRQALQDAGKPFDEVVVTSRNGLVQLSGTVDLPQHRHNAEDIASRQPQVVGVQNDIVVKR